MAGIDPVTQEVADPACVPRCLHCGGEVFMNVRGGDWFVEEPYRPQMERWRAWFGGMRPDERLLLLDVGSGFNTPSVVRWPMERIALRDPLARIVKINLHHADLPRELGGRGLSVAAGAEEASRRTEIVAGGRGPCPARRRRRHSQSSPPIVEKEERGKSLATGDRRLDGRSSYLRTERDCTAVECGLYVASGRRHPGVGRATHSRRSTSRRRS